MALTINLQESTPDPIKRLILLTDSPQIISIKEEDVEDLVENTEILQACVKHGDSVEDAVQKLAGEAVLFENAKKAILVIRIGGSYEPNMAEITAINSVIAKFPDYCDVKWGLSKLSKEDYKVCVVCAVAKSS